MNVRVLITQDSEQISDTLELEWEGDAGLFFNGDDADEGLTLDIQNRGGTTIDSYWVEPGTAIQISVEPLP